MGLFEKQKLTSSERADWSWMAGMTSQYVLGEEVDGLVYLGGELEPARKPRDSVWMLTEYGELVKLHEDYGQWKSLVKELVGHNPRKDDVLSKVGKVVKVASAVVGGALAFVPGVGPGVAAGAAAAGQLAARALEDAAGRAEAAQVARGGPEQSGGEGFDVALEVTEDVVGLVTAVAEESSAGVGDPQLWEEVLRRLPLDSWRDHVAGVLTRTPEEKREAVLRAAVLAAERLLA